MNDEAKPASPGHGDFSSIDRSARHGGVVAGTLVHTDKGMLRIEDVRVGDLLLSTDEHSHEAIYSRVACAGVDDGQLVRAFAYCADDLSLTVHVCYVTASHSFWVDGSGWTTADDVREGRFVRLAAGAPADVMLNRLVLRAPESGFGWVGTNLDHRSDSAFIVDFRTGSNLWQYHVMKKDQLDVRYVEGDIDILAQMEVIRASDDAFLKTRVFHLELEGSCSYVIGEKGLLVRG